MKLLPGCFKCCRAQSCKCFISRKEREAITSIWWLAWQLLICQPALGLQLSSTQLPSKSSYTLRKISETEIFYFFRQPVFPQVCKSGFSTKKLSSWEAPYHSCLLACILVDDEGQFSSTTVQLQKG